MKRLLVVLSLFVATGMCMLAQSAQAQTNIFNPPNNPQAVCKKQNTASSSICTADGSKDPISGSDGILMKATKLIALVSGTIAVIVIFIAAFVMVTSGDNEGKIAGARKTIYGALIGLAIIVSTQTIVIFVVSKVL